MADEAKPRNSVQMGWGALPMSEQHPILPEQIASNFDDDNQAISRLRLRGLITEAQAAAARKKYAIKVATAIKVALSQPRTPTS